jgi:HEAT repeat protein
MLLGIETALLLIAQAPIAGPVHGEVAQMQAHYENVLVELRAAGTDHLPAEVAERRNDLIGELARYCEAGVFGVNPDPVSGRIPQFVDANGRRCAVAQLLHATGRDDVVGRVASERNDAFVCDLAQDDELGQWLARFGLTLEEAARIQLPTLPNRPGGRPVILDFGPEGPNPAGAGSVADRAGPSVPLGGGAGPAAPPAPVPTLGSGVTPPIALTDPNPPWWLWWEMNKLDYLRPNRLNMLSGPVSGYAFGDSLPTNLLNERRGELFHMLLELLEDKDERVRGAAAIALGRVAGADAVFFIRPLLEDEHGYVREQAILALGATGARTAAPLLLEIARHGNTKRSKRGRLTPDARPLAIVALGLGRRAGMPEEVDADVAKLLAERRLSDRASVGFAALLYQTLVSSGEVGAVARKIAEDGHGRFEVRGRAVEAIALEEPGVAAPALTRHLNGGRVDLRRSAALGLGGVESELATPALKTAFEMEHEPLTRGFLLLSIGRQGGEDARDFLTRVLADDDRVMRPWAALALGIAAHDTDDANARKAIREGMEREKNATSFGAYLLASGISGDLEARDRAIELLIESKNVRTRMYAALCLGMLGDEPSRAALAKHMPQERSSMVAVNVAHALGCIGDGRDAAPLVENLERLERQPVMQPLAAVALGFHGSRVAFDGLLDLAHDAHKRDTTRAAAVDALGMMLARRPSLQLAQLSRQANFTLFPDWMEGLLQVTL